MDDKIKENVYFFIVLGKIYFIDLNQNCIYEYNPSDV